MKIVYLYCDLVCESSLLVLILRAITTPDDLKASEDCITVARNTLDLHEQCMELVRGCKDPELVTKYTTWYVSRNLRNIVTFSLTEMFYHQSLFQHVPSS